jgi:hypothetical protein
MMDRSVGSSCGSGPSDLPSLVFALEFQELLDDFVGVYLELVGKMGAHFVLEFLLPAVQLEIALSECSRTWYFLREDSLSLEGSKSSFTLTFDIATKY